MSGNGKVGKDKSFLEYLEEKGYKFDYRTYDFLYDHNGPCPQVARDHPFGQAPEVLNIPKEEWDDWNKYVYDYYISQGVSFALNVAEYSFEPFLQGLLSGTIGSGYGDIDDEAFAVTLGEGVYSKFLCSLQDYPEESQKRWGNLSPDREYFVSDFSCMRVINKPWDYEYVATTIVLLSRPKGEYNTPDAYGADPQKSVYRADAIDLYFLDKATQQWQQLPRPLTPADKDAWWLAKYFVLQGAIHRINLIDHTKVHFPSDAINALTKTVLPKRNLVFQLLMPHFWLSLPVNNAVLEGDRSLINRNTWYPWSPFVAKGEEVRKLLPFGWYGSKYYEKEDAYFETPNPSYPAYRFELQPAQIPSRYGLFFADYFKATKAFVTKVVNEIPRDDPDHTDWVEIQDWATQIASWIPGFPDWNDLPDTAEGRETLANALSMIILNAAVIHTADHGTTHQMFQMRPVPYILRTPAPDSPNYTKPSGTVKDFLDKLHREGRMSDATYNSIMNTLNGNLYGRTLLAMSFVPLAYPGDLIAGRMTDLLFYLPHNTSLLIDCDYQFTAQGQKKLEDEIARAMQEKQYAEEHQYELKSPRLDPVRDRLNDKIDELERQLLEPTPPRAPHFKPGVGKRLQDAINEFQGNLRKISPSYQNEIKTLGFPMLEAVSPVIEPNEELENLMRTRCIGAGIQY